MAKRFKEHQFDKSKDRKGKKLKKFKDSEKVTKKKIKYEKIHNKDVMFDSEED